MNVTAELQNSPALVAEFRRLGRRLDMSAQDVMERSGRMVAISDMRFSLPFGTTKKAQQAGEGAVRRDVSRALRPTGGDAGLGAALAWHQSKRGPNGKVSQGVDQLDVSQSVYDAAVAANQAKVGRAKAAFGQAALQLGAPRIPKWIGRHDGKWTRANLGKRRWRPGAEITSRLRYASDVLPSRQQRRAIQSGMRNALRGMQRQIERQAGIFNRRQRR
jgi:hypothetical protein